jgi:hypothetical protein
VAVRIGVIVIISIIKDEIARGVVKPPSRKPKNGWLTPQSKRVSYNYARILALSKRGFIRSLRTSSHATGQAPDALE